ncbi:hypothetical protein B0675_39695 [Streptomyces sp. M41(2017)]|uniref:hypothetical protein n=1 Tax=Streptomyces sp. M41(2017) TaxID=1955065 RepID=UPI0009BD6791|nr:hypothetical protein [Streptomyces sp. M41(2017)]OQQ12950.1 hypothetical protein B0675_39695 [Streptomyces sp. M41(2017)]
MRIDQAIDEVLDAIGDDPEYAEARRELDAASDALRTGTTAEAHSHLVTANRLLAEACPI